MNIQSEQKKPHRKHMSIAQEFTVSFTIIKSGVTIVYIGKEFESIHWMWLYLTDHLTHGVSINIRVQHINSHMSNQLNQLVITS